MPLINPSARVSSPVVRSLACSSLARAHQSEGELVTLGLGDTLENTDQKCPSAMQANPINGFDFGM